MESKKRDSEKLRQVLTDSIYLNNGKINAKETAEKCGVSTAAVYSQLERLEKAGLVTAQKEGRSKVYSLVNTIDINREYKLESLDEDIVLRKDMAPVLDGVSATVRSVFTYVFTEMLNNAIDHSESETANVHAYRNASVVGCVISDNGVGIFTKIQKAMGLEEKRFAILELAKGKFTTDPSSHTGEGVFFSSKVADRFFILSDGLEFVGDNCRGEAEPIMKDKNSDLTQGTRVCFEISLARTLTFADIANRYSEAPEDYGFSKTIVPVRLLEYREANPMFVSRSQAKRLLARFDRFKNIVLDFAEIDEIGQGFADEVFRVFALAHPDCSITYINASPLVERMIKHVLSRA